ncbi:MAG: serine/threonine protein kinase [Acidobacteria bacterium]|nr:serine/threonine protein kinase [Acidobacteriota bacterium]
MEWLPGGSVKDRLNSGPLQATEAVAIAEETLDALAYLHRHGVVHRDVKPSNLLLAADGSVKLADLGLVRNLADAQDLIRTGATVGTPDYMSPEQLRGRPPAPPTDLYGLGVTLYELLAGSWPFSGQSEFDVADGHLHSAAPSLSEARPDCPRWLARFVRRLLEKRPADRWRDADAALAALSRRRVASRRRWRHLGWAALALAVAMPALWIATTGHPPALAGAKVIDNHTVAGVAPEGHELWRRRLPGRIQSTAVADVTGDKAPEAVVAVQ